MNKLMLLVIVLFMSIAHGVVIASTSTNAMLVPTYSTTVLASNYARKYAIVVNVSDTDMWIRLGTGVTVNSGIPVAKNFGSYEIVDENLYVGAITAVCSTINKTIVVVEGQ
jgi:hypothetical protein